MFTHCLPHLKYSLIAGQLYRLASTCEWKTDATTIRSSEAFNTISWPPTKKGVYETSPKPYIDEPKNFLLRIIRCSFYHVSDDFQIPFQIPFRSFLDAPRYLHMQLLSDASQMPVRNVPDTFHTRPGASQMPLRCLSDAS